MDPRTPNRQKNFIDVGCTQSGSAQRATGSPGSYVPSGSHPGTDNCLEWEGACCCHCSQTPSCSMLLIKEHRAQGGAGAGRWWRFGKSWRIWIQRHSRILRWRNGRGGVSNKFTKQARNRCGGKHLRPANSGLKNPIFSQINKFILNWDLAKLRSPEKHYNKPLTTCSVPFLDLNI